MCSSFQDDFFFLKKLLGDGLTVPKKFSLCEKQGEMKASLDGKPRTDLAAFENGGELIYYWLILNISSY